MTSGRHNLRNEKTAGAMTVAHSGKFKSADDCIVSASSRKINGEAVIHFSNDDGHAQSKPPLC